MIDSRTAPYAALLLRLALGSMFVAHALLKLFVFTLPGTVQFFQSLGLPGVLAYVTFAAELVGGVMLILGVGSRWVAAALLPFLIRRRLGSRRQRVALQRAEGRMGIPGVPDRCGHCPDTARRWCLRPGRSIQRPLDRAPANRLTRNST